MSFSMNVVGFKKNVSLSMTKYLSKMFGITLQAYNFNNCCKYHPLRLNLPWYFSTVFIVKGKIFSLIVIQPSIWSEESCAIK